MIWNAIRKADHDTKVKIYEKLKDFYNELSVDQMQYMLESISNSEINTLIKEELEFATRVCNSIKRDSVISNDEKSKIISNALDIFWKAMCDDTGLSSDVSKIASKSLSSVLRDNKFSSVDDTLELEFVNRSCNEAIKNIKENRNNLNSIA